MIVLITVRTLKNCCPVPEVVRSIAIFSFAFSSVVANWIISSLTLIT